MDTKNFENLLSSVKETNEIIKDLKEPSREVYLWKTLKKYKNKTIFNSRKICRT